MDIITELPTEWEEIENSSLGYISGISNFALPLYT